MPAMPLYARVLLIYVVAAMLLACALRIDSHVYRVHAEFQATAWKIDFLSRGGRGGVRVYCGEMAKFGCFDFCQSEVFQELPRLPMHVGRYPYWSPMGGRYAVLAFDYWFVAVAAGLTAFLIWKLVPRRRMNGTCSRCGYDLRASVNTCPECGTAFENSDQSRVTILPGTQAITTCMRTILILFVVLATTACQSARRTVTSQQQAVALIQAYERAYLQSVHGPSSNMPLTSAQPPHLVLETEDTYKVEFRGPANTPQGLDIKVFHVNQYTGKVTRGMWTTAK